MTAGPNARARLFDRKFVLGKLKAPGKEFAMIAQVEGIYPWPYDGPWLPRSAALIVVDMQRDYLDPRGWFALTGGNAAPFTAIVPVVARVLDAARRAGIFVVFTVECYRSDLLNLPANRLWRSERLGRPIGAEGPLGRHLVQGALGTDIVAQLAPLTGEPVAPKSGKSAFIATDLDHLLRKRSIRNLIFSGIATDGAVQCSLRDANDRGYECLLLEDAAASDVPGHHADQLHTLSLAGGHYGSIAKADDLIRVLSLVEAVP
jgi:biuret amidohydrolase